MAQPIYNNNNVYILGAGFSADARVPVVQHFLTKMRDSVDWLQSAQPRNASQRLKHTEDVFRFRQEASAAAYRVNINVEDIEQLFSLASATEASAFDDSIIESIASTIDYSVKTATQDHLDLLIPRDSLPAFPRSEITGPAEEERVASRVPRYDLYTGSLLGLRSPSSINTRKPSENVFITFNYDTVLEESIWNLNLKVNYGLKRAGYEDFTLFDASDGVPVLKLHGSVNWTQPGTSGQQLKVFRDYDSSLPSNLGHILLPPTWQKTFHGPLQSIWDQAVSAISQATRIIIIGFSIPETDIHFKYLLSAGLQKNISLRKILFVNPLRENEFRPRLNKIFHQPFIHSDNLQHFSINVESFVTDLNCMLTIGRGYDPTTLK
ncbi:MAG TPA: hypothetical protein DEA96_10095 [Leptospiraceae bacterium]|nr:hypothetical protein [Spirochaetaceae bacterium]HBS05307.1 hypothetical protein [Leptospiraceae bacterium]|tara:strand:+ start:3698 stop:4834 length:1137 start_codon:yes stop_codon:yes gene_type:complete